jgi:hypothetical protein
MLSLANRIRVLFPEAEPEKDFILVSDSKGGHIGYWNPALGQEPTVAELDAVTEDMVKKRFYKKFRRAEYSDFGDLADELLRTMEKAGMIIEGTGLAILQASRNAIKLKYPKG